MLVVGMVPPRQLWKMNWDLKVGPQTSHKAGISGEGSKRRTSSDGSLVASQVQAMPMFEDASFGLTVDESNRYTELDNKVEKTEAEEEEYALLDEKMGNAFDILDLMVEGSANEEQKQSHAEFMKTFYNKSWHLANYVKSLSPEKRHDTAIGNNVSTVTILRE